MVDSKIAGKCLAELMNERGLHQSSSPANCM